jgi:hypothetical protein
MRHTLTRAAVLAAIVAGALAAAAGSLLLLDRVNAPPASADPGVAMVDTTRHSRLLILHIDSWRYETATDSALMPQVARLRARGASWEMETVFEGFTVPAVRAAFAGHAETQLVNFIQNFRVRDLGIESFFQDASRAGKRTLVVGNEPFTQFGPYFEQRLPDVRGRSMYETDRLRPGIAMRAWLDEKFDVVVCHYESTDWVAHEVGIASPRYRQEFAFADSLVASFAAALGPRDYLLVYGDHGHNANGEHKTGLHIPTFGLLLGPDVKRDVTVGPIATGNIRYIASHALGITLRPKPYQIEELSRFIPTPSDTRFAEPASLKRGASRSAVDYILALAVALLGLAIGMVLARGVPGERVSPFTATALVALFTLEVVVQRYRAPGATVFPFVLIALGATSTRLSAWWRAAIVLLGAWFAARTMGVAQMLTPPGVIGLIPLYALAIGAKLLVLDGVAGRDRWRSVAAWTTAITLVELRVWDSPVSCFALLAAGVVALVKGSDGAERRVARIVILPIFQLAWMDLFIASVWLVTRERDGAGTDTLIVTGSFALTSGWLASGLEWGFLYALFPAHVVERQVQYFIPFILAKIPLVLVLTLAAIGRRPGRRLIEVLMMYAGVRFGLAWILRLGGAPSVEIWPLAEQAIYLTTFVLAGVVWAWKPGVGSARNVIQRLHTHREMRRCMAVE